MGMEGLLGNDGLKARLQAALQQDRLSHCFLITGPEGSGKRTLARLLAAALQCTAGEKPCLRCAQCRKVLERVHPDVIFVEDREHKAVAVKLVRSACADLYIRPNEGSRKIYVFAQELNPQGQNALLKCIEEPPAYGVFLLLSDHAEQMLPTVRSRCVELRLSPLPSDLLRGELLRRFPEASPEAISGAIARSGGYLGQAKALLEGSVQLFAQTQALVQGLLARSQGEILRLTASMETMKREKLRPILQQWYWLVSQAAASQRGLPAPCAQAAELAASRSMAELLLLTDRLREAAALLEANVGIRNICGLLAVTLQ